MVGVVTPITAMSIGVPSAPAISVWTAIFAGIWFRAAAESALVGTMRVVESQGVNSGRIFATFVIPAFVSTAAYLAVRAHKRAGRQLDRKPPGE